jgi:hypothetical protein
MSEGLQRRPLEALRDRTRAPPTLPDGRGRQGPKNKYDVRHRTVFQGGASKRGAGAEPGVAIAADKDGFGLADQLEGEQGRAGDKGGQNRVALDSLKP